MSVTVTIVIEDLAGETFAVINNCLHQIDKCILEIQSDINLKNKKLLNSTNTSVANKSTELENVLSFINQYALNVNDKLNSKHDLMNIKKSSDIDLVNKTLKNIISLTNKLSEINKNTNEFNKLLKDKSFISNLDVLNTEIKKLDELAKDNSDIQKVNNFINLLNNLIDNNNNKNQSNNSLSVNYKEDIDTKFINFLKQQKCILNSEIEKISKFNGLTMDNESKEYLEILKNVDSLAKRITNIISNKRVLEFFGEQIKLDEQEVFELIRENGVMGYEAINNLRDKKMEINAKNVFNEIENIRYNEMNSNKLNEYKKMLKQYVDDLGFESGDLRFELKSYIDNFSSPQEITDCFAYINSKKSEIDKIDKLAKSIFDKLAKEENFKLFETVETNMDTYGLVRKTFTFKNQIGNVIDISIDGQLNIRYQAGNYVGHACEKTSDLILDAIRSTNAKITSQKVSRNTSNAHRYMYMKG